MAEAVLIASSVALWVSVYALVKRIEKLEEWHRRWRAREIHSRPMFVKDIENNWGEYIEKWLKD